MTKLHIFGFVLFFIFGSFVGTALTIGYEKQFGEIKITASDEKGNPKQITLSQAISTLDKNSSIRDYQIFSAVSSTYSGLYSGLVELARLKCATSTK